MRKFFLLLLFLFLVPLAKSQTTTVSATITDAGSQAWANGTWSITFKPAPNWVGPSTTFPGGSTFTQFYSGSLNGSGAFSQTGLQKNDFIAPSGSQWIFQVCSAATAPCYQQILTINSANCNSSCSLSSLIVPPILSVLPTYTVYAYSDSEIKAQAQGAFYTNISDNTIHYCSTVLPCTWLSLPSTGSNPSFNSLTVTHPAITANSIEGIFYSDQFGVQASSLDNTTALQNAWNAAYETGTSSATRGVVYITADSSGGTLFKFAGTLNAKLVPTYCIGPSTSIGSGLSNITLDFTLTSGVFIKNVGDFHGCNLIGTFTFGSALSGTLTNLVEGSHNTVTATTSVPTSLIQGATVIVSGTTNYNGVYRVASIVDSSDFTFQVGTTSLATETSGTINYYPTVALMSNDPSASAGLSCCSVHWSDIQVMGFGTDLDISSLQSGAASLTAASTNDGEISGVNRLSGLVGILATGNGRVIGDSNGNVANMHIYGTTQIQATIGLWGGPKVTGSADTEESSFGNNEIEHINFMADPSASDSPFTTGINITSYGNSIHDNYLTTSTPGTDDGMINTASETDGPNYVFANRLSSANLSSVTTSWLNDNAGQSKTSLFGFALQSGINIASLGTSADLISATVVGPSGGTTHAYKIVSIDFTGGQALPSAHWICPNGTLVSSAGSCPANIGPLSPSGSNYERVCVSRNPNLFEITILQDLVSTALSGLNPIATGTNGNNCFAVGTQNTAAYTPLTNDASGGINETNIHALNNLGVLSLGGGQQISSSNNIALTSQLPLRGNGSIGGTIINAGTCTNEGTVTVTGVTTSMQASVSAGGGTLGTNWANLEFGQVYVSSANTVTIYMCNATAGNLTPASSVVQVSVSQ